jgi:hypothetical protein
MLILKFKKNAVKLETSVKLESTCETYVILTFLNDSLNSSNLNSVS